MILLKITTADILVIVILPCLFFTLLMFLGILHKENEKHQNLKP